MSNIETKYATIDRDELARLRKADTHSEDGGEVPAPCTVYVECRQCDECQWGGINDAAAGLAACHDCDWTGPEPSEDKCPGCQRENCMAAACPKCGARYALVASEKIAASAVPDLVAQHLRIVAAKDAELKELRDSMAFRTSLIGRLEAERDELRAQPARQVGGEREAFENWYTGGLPHNGFKRDSCGGGYLLAAIDQAWKGWQARALLGKS